MFEVCCLNKTWVQYSTLKMPLFLVVHSNINLETTLWQESGLWQSTKAISDGPKVVQMESSITEMLWILLWQLSDVPPTRSKFPDARTICPEKCGGSMCSLHIGTIPCVHEWGRGGFLSYIFLIQINFLYCNESAQVKQVRVHLCSWYLANNIDSESVVITHVCHHLLFSIHIM